MLKTILSPLTTATSLGVAIRYLTTIISSVITILAVLEWLSPEQADALTKQVPELLGAVAALIMAAIPIYAILTKSSSDKAAEAAKAIDKEIPPATPVEIKTPGASPDIFISGK